MLVKKFLTYKYNYDDIMKMYNEGKITVKEIKELVLLHDGNGIDPISAGELMRNGGPLKDSLKSVLSHPIFLSLGGPNQKVYRYDYDEIMRMYNAKEITLEQIIKLSKSRSRNGIDPMSISKLKETGLIK